MVFQKSIDEKERREGRELKISVCASLSEQNKMVMSQTNTFSVEIQGWMFDVCIKTKDFYNLLHPPDVHKLPYKKIVTLTRYCFVSMPFTGATILASKSSFMPAV